MTLADDRATMPTVQQIIEADPGPAAPAMLRPSPPGSFGTEDIPIERYTSRAFLGREYERVWYRVWQWACREEDIPEVGDHMVYDIGRYSILVVRSAPDTIKAYHNSCLHRSRRLKDGPGNSPTLTCGFHAWSWKLDGSLAKVPCRWDFPQVRDADFALPEVRLETWQGFVFINLDADGAPLADSLDVLPEHIRLFPLEDRFTAANVSKVLPINWKAGLEAFLESYHIMATHPNIIEWTGDANTQYDTWDTVSRFITAHGVPSPHLGTDMEQSEVYDIAMEYLAAAMGGVEPPPLPDGLPARAGLADFVRGALGAGLGLDLSAKSISEIWDSIEYFLFPNWAFFVGVATPFHYRFRPNGDDPNSCLFDIRWLMPLPPGAPRPPSAPRRHLGPDEPFSAAPELASFGGVLDQDMGNLGAIQLGMTSAVKPGITLGGYQESRIRHFHSLLDRWMEQ